jgi:sulfatase maturation enzyme AslB (radical SAM superfamily)
MESKCAAFWHHTNIRSDNRIFPCCRFKNPIAKFDGDISQVLFLKEYDELRKQSIDNIPIKGCEKCYHEEKIGKKSLRQEFNEVYNFETISMEYLEIGFDNICNLTCDGCYEEFSSAWSKLKYPEAKKTIHIKSTQEIIELPNSLKKVLFLGGEPLMTNRHQKFLNIVKDKSNVEIVYNTNGTFLLDKNTINLLEQFKTVSFIVSIDGFKDLNEQVRGGSKWEQVIEFIRQIKTTKFNLSVNTVVHTNNWFGLKELEQYIEEINVPWTINFVTYPTHLDLINVKEKHDLVNLLKSIKTVNLEYIINHVN